MRAIRKRLVAQAGKCLAAWSATLDVAFA